MHQLMKSVFVFLATISSVASQQDTAAQEYLNTYNSQLEALYYRSSMAAWAYYTNLTTYNQEVMVQSIYRSR